ncbi:hypothetical protein D0Z00_002073 [Geotrichum galactomycetum]|uniref:Uncharacterized protein n=1 Tax=Geotrichum galactomycetum TaxID=27317 RepID=A0ACB6V5B8_9ASCO|nr:hypothetical protein D0Z00_002073 [Geotrichum candidum]
MKLNATRKAATEESVESRYFQKCLDLKRKVLDIEQHNELLALSINRNKRDLKRLRVEKVVLLEKLNGVNRLLDYVEVEVESEESADEVDETLNEPIESEDESVSEDDKKTGNSQIAKKTSSIGEESTPPVKKKPPPRDPKLPKRPQNAYILFCEREKESVKRELELSNKNGQFDLTKAMAEKWHELPSEDKKEFYEMYESDRERYVREMVAYVQPNPSPSVEKEMLRAKKMMKEIESERSEGKRPRVKSGSALAKLIEAISGPEAAAEAIGRSKHS